MRGNGTVKVYKRKSNNKRKSIRTDRADVTTGMRKANDPMTNYRVLVTLTEPTFLLSFLQKFIG